MGTAIAEQRKRQVAAVEDMTPGLRSIFNKIKKKSDAVDKDVVLAMYDVGAMVREACGNETKYGEAAVPTLAVALGKAWSENQLWDYQAIADKFTRNYIEGLLEKRTSGGNTITITHIKKLSGLEKPLRKEMTKKMFVDDLTTDELADAIRKALGGRPRSGGGVQPKAPKSVASGLTQIATYPQAVINRAKIWDTHVFDKIDKSSPEECTDALKTSLEATIAVEEAGLEKHQHILYRLNKALVRVESIMAKKKVAKKKAATNGQAGSDKKKVTVKKKKAATKKKVVVKKTPAAGAKKKPAAKKKTAKQPLTARQRIAAAKQRKGVAASA